MTQLLNEQGEVIKDYRYDPFGEEQSVESLAFGGKQATELWRQEIEKIDNPFRYAGEYQDTETGNYYLRARYYDPTSQRFINEDSYGVEKGTEWQENIYNFAGNNPIRYIDPTGHDKYDDAARYEPSNLRDLVKNIGASISYDSKAKAATVVISRNGRNEFYTFRQSDWSMKDGRIQISKSDFNKIISKPGTVYNSKGKVVTSRTVDLGKGWSARKDPPHTDPGQKHVHVYGPNGDEYSQNEDGSIHDGHRTNSNDPPKKVREKLKEKARWDWDKNKEKIENNDITIDDVTNPVAAYVFISVLIRQYAPTILSPAY